MKGLPENVIMDILLRLPVKSIMYSKCVCKQWRNLVLDSYFVNLHMSRSGEHLMIRQRPLFGINCIDPGVLKWIEEIEEPMYPPFMTINPKVLNGIKTHVFVSSSVDGLICVWHSYDTTYILNPVTKQYLILPENQLLSKNYSGLSCGFGVSKGGQYKVIRICQSKSYNDRIEMEVYTLGSDQWRGLSHFPYYQQLTKMYSDILLNNHVYWINGDCQIYCFDLDMETFKLFPSPPRDNEESEGILGVLKGCLSQCSRSSLGFTLWVMKEEQEGMNKCWYKEVIIKQNINTRRWWSLLCLVDDFKATGNSILMVSNGYNKVIVYCLETNTIKDIELKHGVVDKVITYRPSFLKLDKFGSERLHAF